MRGGGVGGTVGRSRGRGFCLGRQTFFLPGGSVNVEPAALWVSWT